MYQLLRKEWTLTRWVQAVAAAFGLILIPVGLMEPRGIPPAILFFEIAYSHLLFSMNRHAAVSRPDNMLLISLPTTRKQIIDGKYVYVLLSAILYPAYLCLILLALKVFGADIAMPILSMWLMSAAVGVMYQLILMPVSFVNPKYAALVSSAIYFMIIIIPSRIDSGVSGAKIADFLNRIAGFLGGWAGPLLLIACLALVGYLSLYISRSFYQRAEF